ncbi:virion structural protein [Cyanophage S-TIM66]|nr:virion structural protein [Cyanophage S-TIM66]
MLTDKSKRQLPFVLYNMPDLVEGAFKQYEANFGKYQVDAVRKSQYEGFLDLFQVVVTRIQEEKPAEVLPLYQKILLLFVKVDLNYLLFATLIDLIEAQILGFISSTGNNEQLNQRISSYCLKLRKSATERDTFLKESTGERLVQLISEYAPSVGVNKQRYSKNNYDPVSRKIFSLITKDAFWEEQQELYKVDPGYYQKLTIYNDELYLLNDNIGKPTGQFDSSEWRKFSSKFLNKSNKINEKIRKNVEGYVSSALANAKNVNPIISDSSVTQKDTGLKYDEKDLSLTLGGKGKQFVRNLLSLRGSLTYTAGSQGSAIGSVDYAAKFDEYFFSCIFGKSIVSGFSDLGGSPLFGDFNTLYNYGLVQNEIAGLSFLEGFRSLKSFNQNIELPPEAVDAGSDYVPYALKREPEVGNVIGGQVVTTGDKTYELTYNPIAAKYYYGLQDRYKGITVNPYSEKTNVDLILYGLERMVVISDQLADVIESVNDSLNEDGLVPGYEGWGSMKIHLQELSDIFVSTPILNTQYADKEIMPGFNGGVRYLYNSYKKMSDVIVDPIFAGSAMEDLLTWGRAVQNNLDQILSGIESLGYLPGTFVGDISFKFSNKDRSALVDQLRSLNFQENEINEFLSAESFKDLIEKFAPISDSRDQISFLRGYELSQLLYEFGGEEAIDAYLQYLYSRDSNGLEKLLMISLKDRSDAVVYNEQRFGKLVGLLLNLTFAIDKNQIELFKKFLSQNQLDLFESISYLLSNKEVNLLKDKDSISLLKPIVNSLIFGTSKGLSKEAYNIDYPTANEIAPTELKKFTDVINYEIGDVPTRVLQNLYDRSFSLTSEELFNIFGSGSFYSEYGQLMDGYSGGQFTRIINFAYVSGLLHKLSYYNNSYQVPNFLIKSPIFSELVLVIKSLSSLMSLVLDNFANSLEFTLSQNNKNIYPFENIISTSNNKIEEISNIIAGLTPEGNNLSDFGSPSVNSTAEIIGSPGIGNSPVPESIPLENSITPEQSKILSTEISTNYSFIAPAALKGLSESEKLNKFIGLIEDTKIITGFSKESTEKEYFNVQVDKNNNIVDNLKETNKVPKAYQNPQLREELIQIEEDNLLAKGLVSQFNTIESCKKFGGTKCEETFSGKENQCGSPTNKAVYSQRDNSNNLTTSENSSIKIDRPLGSEEINKPKEVFLTQNVPAYFSILPGESITPSSNGDPLINTLSSEPIVFKKDGSSLEALYSSYYNSEFGLIEAIKAKFEKDEPFKCSLLEDPYAYQACMNLIKCKKFNRQGNAKFLKFCPKTLSGGSLK